jgi:hypothetical protein
MTQISVPICVHLYLEWTLKQGAEINGKVEMKEQERDSAPLNLRSDPSSDSSGQRSFEMVRFAFL